MYVEHVNNTVNIIHNAFKQLKLLQSKTNFNFFFYKNVVFLLF